MRTQLRMTISSSSTIRILALMVLSRVLLAALGRRAVRAAGRCGTWCPRPTALSTSIAPPWALTMPWLTDRPSPVPLPTSLVVKNGSKIRCRFSSGMPQPVSMIDDLHHRHRRRCVRRLARLGAAGVRTMMLPCSSIACWALTSMFITTCLIRSASTQTGGSVAVEVERMSMSRRCGRPLDDAHRVLDELVEVGEFLLRRLLAREIQQPPDDAGAALGLADHQVEVLGILAAVGHLLAQQMEKVSTPVSGLFSSCAMPEASSPTEASFSPRTASAWARRNSWVRSSTFLLERARPTRAAPPANCASAAVIALNEAASWPNSSPLRTGIGCSRLPGGEPLARPLSRSRSGT